MKDLPPCYGIIPARYASTRFPGKPLSDILGKPMFWHVYQRARQCPQLNSVYLAADDDRIITAARTLDVPVLKTRQDHQSGTDRILEAARQLKLPDTAVIVNIQGDEPVLNPDMLTQLVQPFQSTLIQVTTLIKAINAAMATNPDQVKVVFSQSLQALYFSRAILPPTGPWFGHIGLYAFRMAALEQFNTYARGKLESIEKLEQLRFLENEIPIHLVLTEYESISVDRPDDLEAVCNFLKNNSSRPL